MFKDRLRTCRKKLGLSQAALAKKVFVSQQAIAKWESDKATPNPEMLTKLANALNVSLDYLLGNDVSPQQKPLTDKDGLTARDNRDIAKDMERIKEKLLNKEDGPASFDGENISDESAELLLTQIESMLRTIKVINKEKYNPYKNKAGDTHGNSH